MLGHKEEEVRIGVGPRCEGVRTGVGIRDQGVSCGTKARGDENRIKESACGMKV